MRTAEGTTREGLLCGWEGEIKDKETSLKVETQVKRNKSFTEERSLRNISTFFFFHTEILKPFGPTHHCRKRQLWEKVFTELRQEAAASLLSNQNEHNLLVSGFWVWLNEVPAQSKI